MTKKRPGPPQTSARLYLEELCRKFPDASNLGLAKRAKAERPNSFRSVETARSTIRSIRGAHGTAKKKFATQPRPKGVAGQVPKMPPKPVNRVGTIRNRRQTSRHHLRRSYPIPRRNSVLRCREGTQKAITRLLAHQWRLRRLLPSQQASARSAPSTILGGTKASDRRPRMDSP